MGTNRWWHIPRWKRLYRRNGLAVVWNLENWTVGWRKDLQKDGAYWSLGPLVLFVANERRWDG